MEIRLAKWEKGSMQRIYFNSLALSSSSKVYAYANESGLFAIGQSVNVPGQSGIISDVTNLAVEKIEAAFGKPISHDTKFADVWAVVQ